MKKAYFVKTITKNGKARCDIITAQENENFRYVVGDCNSVYYFETKRKAEEVARAWNEGFKRNCKYLNPWD